MTLPRWAAGLLLAVGLWLQPQLSAAAPGPTFPALSGRVVDQANLLTPATETALTGKLAALETRTGRQLVVATVLTLGGYEIEEYGYRLGRAWGIGRKEDDDGAILLVAPNERAVRIEVGYGLEGVLTDAVSSTIIQGRMLPRFRAGDFPGGIVAGTDALVELLSLPDGEARARATAAEVQPAAAETEDGPPLIVIILVVLFVLWLLTRGGGRRGRRRRGGGGLANVLIWSAINSAANSRGGGWSGGGGGFGGGGFSGGGGSFGGGGASGRW